MRIEEVGKAKLSKACDKELLILKLRFTQAWDRNLNNKSPIVVSDLTCSKFLKRYKLLLDELNARKLEHSTSVIDKAAFKKAMVMSKYGIDVSDLEDIVVVSDCVVVGVPFVEDVAILVEKRRTEIFESLGQTEDAENAYIPLYDLVLKAKQETTVVEISKPYPNEHSARLQNPKMAHIRVGRTHGSGKGKVQGADVPVTIDIIWYVTTKDGKEVPIAQALRFPIKNWTAAKAKKWLSDNDITAPFEPATEVSKKLWSGKYVNDLPDSAFLYIESGGEKDDEDKTKPRSLRHFPYIDSSGKVDLLHLRNALARISQSNLPKTVQDKVSAKAGKILEDIKEGKKFEKFVSVYPVDKADEDEQIVCGVVYEPDTVDAQGDKADEIEIRKAAYQFMEEVQSFRVMHKGKKVNVKVLESYIAPVDFTVLSKSIKKGSWLLTARVLDKKIWKAVKDGELTGFSMAGYAKTA